MGLPEDVPETRYARSGDAYIAYQVIGEGPIDLLLVPHFFHHLELWWEDRHRATFARELAKFARVILLDKRGTGLSDRTGSVPPFDVQMDDVRAILDAARSKRAILWAAADASPMILLFAATFPQRTLALVLWDPFPTYIRNAEMPWLMTRAEFADAVAESARALVDPTGRFLAEVAPSLGSEAERRAYWRVSRLGTSPGDHYAFTNVLAETDVRHVLPAIRVPTLVLSNEALSDNHQTTRYVAEKIPNARREILPGRDRLMFVGETAPLIAAVSAFVKEIREMPPSEPDRILATVLFTDLVGSTAKAVELGPGWQQVLREHNAVIRRELARYSGREVDTAGDGFFASGFDGPARAIRCGCAIRDAIAGLGLGIRVGVHTGECDVVDDKLSGLAVNIGARVAAQAVDGEVLVSGTVKDLVAGSGITFEPRGVRELKGLGEWPLYAVGRSDRDALVT